MPVVREPRRDGDRHRRRAGRDASRRRRRRKSWAARPDSDVAIWTITLAAGATWTLPAARAGTNRTLYFFRGTASGRRARGARHRRRSSCGPTPRWRCAAGDGGAELLLLQGRPIGEPVVAARAVRDEHARQEIQQAFADYRRTEFGGWPWPSDGPVHPREDGRFARHADGRVENASVEVP